jgi:hypothetical protein
VVEQQGTIGVIGAFDTDAFDAQLRSRILVAELARRRPDHVVRCFAPFAAGAPFPSGSTEPVEPLTDLGGRPWPGLGGALDLAVVTVDDVSAAASLTASLATTSAGGTGAAVVWHAVGAPGAGTARAAAEHAALVRRISMLDDGSPDHWGDPDGLAVAATVPHPGVLAARVFPRDVRDARLELLRALDAWPRVGSAIVVHGGPEHVDTVDAVRAPEDSAVVALGEDGYAAAVVARDPVARRVPSEASAEDLVAAIAGAAGVISSSPAVIAVARAFGVRYATIEELRARGSRSIVELLHEPSGLDDDVARADGDLDAIAALAAGPAPPPLAWSQLAAAEAALDARGRRLAAERAAMADAVVHERERARVLEQRLAEAQAAYDDVRNLEVVRWRVALGNLRTRLGLRRGRKFG